MNDFCYGGEGEAAVEQRDKRQWKKGRGVSGRAREVGMESGEKGILKRKGGESGFRQLFFADGGVISVFSYLCKNLQDFFV